MPHSDAESNAYRHHLRHRYWFQCKMFVTSDLGKLDQKTHNTVFALRTLFSANCLQIIIVGIFRQLTNYFLKSLTHLHDVYFVGMTLFEIIFVKRLIRRRHISSIFAKKIIWLLNRLFNNIREKCYHFTEPVYWRLT